MIRRRRIAAAALGLWGAAIAQTDGPGLYLFKIPTSRGSTAEVTQHSNAVQIDLHVPNPNQTVERLTNTTLSIVAVEEGLVRVVVGAHETLTTEPGPTHLATSFVVDFEEAPVATLAEALLSAYGNQPSIEQLIEFVDAEISRKTHRRNFDLASQAAISHEGDCTEHAVLLAALARATGRPARVVLGVMLVESPGSVLSLGHAWTEIHDGERWHISDGTRPEIQFPGATTRYVPLMELENEGPGYALKLLELTGVYPARIELIQMNEATQAFFP